MTNYDTENIFAKILRDEIPCTKVYEDEHALAFEDINPQAPRHVLVIPERPYVSLDDFTVRPQPMRLRALCVPSGKPHDGLNLANPGYRILANIGQDGMQEVPHLHVHILGGSHWARC